LLRVLVPPICYEEYPKAEVVSSNLAGRANIFNALCHLAYMPPGCQLPHSYHNAAERCLDE